MKTKIVAVIQARMGSSRFPGKSMEKIGHWPLVELVLKRVQRSRVDVVVLATSTSPLDDVLAEYVDSLGFPVFRGSEEDVLSRFHQAAEKYDPETVVRITGDCPLISPTLIDYAIDVFEEHNVDYLSLAIGDEKPAAYPRGFDVEVARFASLTEAVTNATKEYEREHVMPYLYTHPDSYSVHYIEPTPEYSRPSYRLCVDSKLDFDLILKLHDFFGDRLIDADSLDIIHYLDSNPEVAAINASVKQKHFKDTASKTG
ncbi:MAG: cytidylyltransferase domain-containing protein [Candidatus Hermodarchaeota archaeon]